MSTKVPTMVEIQVGAWVCKSKLDLDRDKFSCPLLSFSSV